MKRNTPIGRLPETSNVMHFDITVQTDKAYVGVSCIDVKERGFIRYAVTEVKKEDAFRLANVFLGLGRWVALPANSSFCYVVTNVAALQKWDALYRVQMRGA